MLDFDGWEKQYSQQLTRQLHRMFHTKVYVTLVTGPSQGEVSAVLGKNSKFVGVALFEK